MPNNYLISLNAMRKEMKIDLNKRAERKPQANWPSETIRSKYVKNDDNI